MRLSILCGFWTNFKNLAHLGPFPTLEWPKFHGQCTHEFLIDFFMQSHRPILYLKRQQKVHPARRFETLRSRQHGLLTNMVHCLGNVFFFQLIYFTIFWNILQNIWHELEISLNSWLSCPSTTKCTPTPD